MHNLFFFLYFVPEFAISGVVMLSEYVSNINPEMRTDFQPICTCFFKDADEF